MIKISLLIVSLISTVVFLPSCKRVDNTASLKQKQYVVKPQTVHKSLFFTGTIQPLRESALSSPIDAVIASMNYHYGQMVAKNDVVVVLDSSELQKQYNDILTDYLKAKDHYTVANAKFTGTQNLWNAGLLSKNNFVSEKSSLANARVTLMQATRKLSEMLEKIDDSDESLSNLSIAQFDKVRQALAGKHNLIHLKATTHGVLLYPPKAGNDKSTRLAVGSSVKSGQVIGLIGDLSGISVEIDVPEIDIDTIHPGMSAKITGVALKEELQGKLVMVNAQATGNSSNALPSFSARVEVAQLTDQQRAFIKVGMSASIELIVDSKSQLMIPIAAITQDNGKMFVQVQHNGKIEQRYISTGAAEADSVVVNAGLKLGDTVVYSE